jgi:membrane protein implicated in regulation of membrane protease activity
MSDGTYVEALARKELITWLFVFIVSVGLLFWHGPSFPLAVLTVLAALCLLTKVLALRRLRRDRSLTKKK